VVKLHGYLVDRVKQTTKEADAMTPAELTADLTRVQAELDAIENPSAAEHKGQTRAALP
jgi:hypothetical protein